VRSNYVYSNNNVELRSMYSTAGKMRSINNYATRTAAILPRNKCFYRNYFLFLKIIITIAFNLIRILHTLNLNLISHKFIEIFI